MQIAVYYLLSTTNLFNKVNIAYSYFSFLIKILSFSSITRTLQNNVILTSAHSQNLGKLIVRIFRKAEGKRKTKRKKATKFWRLENE